MLSTLAVPDKGKSICTYCPASETLFGTRGCGRERERELWLEEYACDWGNGCIAKDRESEIIQDIGRELGHFCWEKIYAKIEHKSVGKQTFLGLLLAVQFVWCVMTFFFFFTWMKRKIWDERISWGIRTRNTVGVCLVSLPGQEGSVQQSFFFCFPHVT